MNMHDARIEISGFTPSSDLYLFLNEELDKIESLCPHNSHFKLLVKNDKGEYEGKLAISSRAFNTEVTKKDLSLTSMILNIIGEAHRKISHWKSLRFNTANSPH